MTWRACVDADCQQNRVRTNSGRETCLNFTKNDTSPQNVCRIKKMEFIKRKIGNIIKQRDML